MCHWNFLWYLKSILLTLLEHSAWHSYLIVDWRLEEESLDVVGDLLPAADVPVPPLRVQRRLFDHSAAVLECLAQVGPLARLRLLQHELDLADGVRNLYLQFGCCVEHFDIL